MTTGDRFWSKVVVAGPNDCWEWTGARHRFGYGMFLDAGNARPAHRVALGLRPGEGVVMHTCDNPPCVNPAHLRVGSMADNNADRDAKGRQRNGRTVGPLGRLHPVRQEVTA